MTEAEYYSIASPILNPHQNWKASTSTTIQAGSLVFTPDGILLEDLGSTPERPPLTDCSFPFHCRNNAVEGLFTRLAVLGIAKDFGDSLNEHAACVNTLTFTYWPCLLVLSVSMP